MQSDLFSPLCTLSNGFAARIPFQKPRAREMFKDTFLLFQVDLFPYELCFNFRFSTFRHFVDSRCDLRCSLRDQTLIHRRALKSRRRSCKRKIVTLNISRARVFVLKTTILVTKSTTSAPKTATPVRISRLYDVRSSCLNVQAGYYGVLSTTSAPLVLNQVIAV